jgi:hypothetical protein
MADVATRMKALELAHAQIGQDARIMGGEVNPTYVIATAEAFERYMTGEKAKTEQQAMSFSQAAMVAHEVIRALQIAHNEEGIALPWHQVSQDIRESCKIGVKRVYDNPEITVEELHDSWVQTKLAQGWTHGPVRNAELKQHHCMVPYVELSAHDKSKDLLFLNTVKACLHIPID